MENTFAVVLKQLVGSSPLLLVYLVGIILALVFWQRYPRPCLLTLLAGLLSLGITILQPFLFQYVIRARLELGWTNAQVDRLLNLNALAGAVVRALAFGLLLAAVFVGRRGSAPAGARWPPLPPAVPASRPADEQGFIRPT